MEQNPIDGNYSKMVEVELARMVSSLLVVEGGPSSNFMNESFL